MRIRRLLTLPAVVAITAAAPAPSPSPIPPALTPYVAESGFTVGDFGWARGRFADASTTERSGWSAAKAWAGRRAAERTAAVRRELRALGVEASALKTGCYGDEACDAVRGFDTAADEFGSWAAFQAALAEAKPQFEGYRLAAANMRSVLPRIEPDKVPLAEKLHYWTILEQVWRLAMSAGPDVPNLPLSGGARTAFNLLVWPEVAKADHANAPKLRKLVDTQGWPKLSEVGAQGATDAWLVVQHADDDPALQLRVLRLMEPMLAAGEVPPRHYGYLYDRVMLKLAGRQRYGTQMRCVAHDFVPEPLEAPERLDELRRGVGLAPHADYRKRFAATC